MSPETIEQTVDRDIAAFLAWKELYALRYPPDRHVPLIDLCPDAREMFEQGKRRTAVREVEYNSEKQKAVRARAVEYSRQYRAERKRRQSWGWRLARFLGVTHAT